MSGADWIVIAAAAASIVWVNWYFFLAERQVAAAREGSAGIQEIEILVKGGYEPASIRVKQGRPVRLLFNRQETSSCSEEVVLGDFGVRRFLPPFKKTSVEFTPRQVGTYDFTCGMGMMHGKLIVD
jgi:plastocyanin domain-containing protein